MTKRVPAVVCAGGHGKVLRPEKSKLGDRIGDKSILVRAVENLEKSKAFSPIIVVVNPLLGEELKEQLWNAGFKNLYCVYQPERRGAANAAHLAMPMLEGLGAESFEVSFGEMPYVKPETHLELARLHHSSGNRPVLSFLASPFDAGHPLARPLSQYAHLKKGWDNGHRTDPFLRMYSGESACDGDDILGSVYMVDVRWYSRVYPRIPPLDNKNDGYGPEYHLPWLVDAAVRNSLPYRVLRRNIPEQILGINDRVDYEIAAQVFEKGN